MTNVSKLNNLVVEVFAELVEGAEEVWMNEDVQKQVKSLLARSGPKKKKDPNAPKRAKSAYLFFCKDNREKVKGDLGEKAKNTDVTRELGARWNALKESKKAADKKAMIKYTKQAAEDRERYDAEKADYVPLEVDETEVSAPKRRGGKKRADGPKRGKSAYLFFCQEHRDSVKEENPEMKATEITSELGRLWKEFSTNEENAEELERYNDLAAEDKARYEAEKEALGESEPAPKTVKGGKKGATKGDAKAKTTATKAAPKKRTKKVDKEPEEEMEDLDDGEEIDENVEIVEEDDGGEEVEEETPAPQKTTKKNTKGKKVEAQTTPAAGDSRGGYRAFCAANREQLKGQFPNTKATEITKKLGAAWKALSKEQQNQWKGSVAV